MVAPTFTLPDQFDAVHSLEDYRGSWVILYFYPKDDTPGCTKEACAFQSQLPAFKERGVVVLGVSKDTTRSHKKFAEKYGLSFPLLSDKEATVIKAYDAWGPKKFMGREFDGILRTTVLINPSGEIVKRYPNVDPVIHAGDILKDLDELQK